MTKSDFITLWARIKPVITKHVNGEPAIECDCEFVNYCGGYQLNIRPQCILWPRDLMFIFSNCELLCCSSLCDFNDGSITVY